MRATSNLNLNLVIEEPTFVYLIAFATTKFVSRARGLMVVFSFGIQNNLYKLWLSQKMSNLNVLLIQAYRYRLGLKRYLT